MSIINNILGFKELEPAVKIDMDNYKPYSNISELREKANAYISSLQDEEFSLEESNPEIKFTVSKKSAEHTTRKAGETKLIITKQIKQIFKQGYVYSVQDEKNKHPNVEHILKCRTFIMLNGEMKEFHFTLKMQKGGKNYFYDGSFNINDPE